MSENTLSLDEIARRTEARIDGLSAAGKFSGAVLLAKDGAPFFRAACGLASRAHNIPNRVDTRFNLGSMNKMFTGVAIAQLAERGCLAFDDPVGKLIPDYPNKEVAGKVTVHQLLTHTSGLGNFFNDKFMKGSRELFRTVNDFLPLMVDEPLLFEPGTGWAYSSSGFLLLGAIVEKVTGMSYFEYVSKNIYEPAGMDSTDAYELDYDWPNLATGYTEMGAEPGCLKNNTFMHVIKGGPAGGGYSTVEDLLRFDVALRGYRLLSREATENLLSAKARLPGTEDGYCYGFSETHEGDERIVGHGGVSLGVNSDLQMYLKSGFTAAVMSNLDPPAAVRVTSRLRYWLTGRGLPSRGAPDTGLLQSAPGEYLMSDAEGKSFTVSLSVEGDALVLMPPDGHRLYFMPLGGDHYISDDVLDPEITLAPGPDGRAEGFRLFGRGPEMKGKRV
jgi:CubicO group peptidase (beta-lactamase class C family)